MRLRHLALVLSLPFSLAAQGAGSAEVFQNAPASVRPYLDQALQARAAQDGEGERRMLEQALTTLGSSHPDSFWIYRMLRQYYADRGNPLMASRMGELEITTAGGEGMKIPAMTGLVVQRSALHDKDGAQAALNALQSQLGIMRTKRNWAQRGSLWQGQLAWATGQMHSSFGHPVEAEAAFQACLSSLAEFGRFNPGEADFQFAECAAELAQLQINQGRLTEAGALLLTQRQLMESALAKQLRPAAMARIAPPLVRVAVEQGRNPEARRIAEEAIQSIQALGAQESSLRLARLRLELARIDMLEGRWASALVLHQARRDGLLQGQGEIGQRGAFSVEYGYTLLRLGKVAEADTVLSSVLNFRQGLYDDKAQPLLEARAFYGLALAAQGRRDEARHLLADAVPRLLALIHGERGSAESGVLRTAQMNWLLEGYLNLLSDVARQGGPEAPAAIEESFRLADIARGSTVQRALAAAASRSIPDNPALADLARKEQDQDNEMAALTDGLNNLLARGRVAEQDKVVADMRARLNTLRSDHEATLKELQRKFPAYAGLLNPQALTPRELQKYLGPDEALVSVYATSDRTLIWAFGAQGAVRFAVAPLGADAVAAAVTRLRHGLDPNEATLGRVSNFDSKTAHQLYASLLAPVAEGWSGARKLVLVPHGPLGQLPFSVLLTEPWQETPGPVPFASMASAPWLIRQVAISQLPAALALPVLRQRDAGRASRASKPFIGFGDPLFSQEAAPASTRAAGAGQPQHRNLAIKPAAAAAVSQANVASALDFSLLSPLPDTAEEIRQVAQALRADAGQDTYLQQRATETNARQTDLRPYRVVMFATHGLVPGEMPGLYQPALALSNPGLTGEAAAPGLDGMLTMEEILTLKLNADWVVLSACNTASSSGKGSEAVSGLGRAFFYAGARALLVTHWPVETVSARLLTTDTFRRQAETPNAPRSVLLQQAALTLMQQQGGQYSYAHPMFWAPYVIVGDGG